LRTWQKVVVIVLVLALAGGAAYWFWIRPRLTSQTTQGQTTLVAVKKGTISQSTSLSGTVALKDQVNVPAKASGQVASIAVKVGQTVAVGDELLRLDLSSMDTEIEMARLSLETAQLKLQELQEPPSDSDLASVRFSLEKAKTDLVQAEASRERVIASTALSLENAQRAVESSERSVERAKASLQSALDDVELSTTSAEMALQNAQTSVDNAQQDLDEAMDAAGKKTAERNLASAEQQLEAQQLSYQQSLQSIQTKVDNAEQAVTDAEQGVIDAEKSLEARQLSNQDSLASADNQVRSAQVSIQQAQLQLDQAMITTSALSIELQQKSIEQSQLSLQKLLDQQAEAVLKAPIAGTVSVVNAVVGNSLSTSGAAVVLVGADSLEIVASVPEVSVAELRAGMTAIVTCDALSGQDIPATLTSLSPFATSSQGVVNYQANFTTTGTTAKQLRQGMTVEVAVITAQAENVLVIPRSAIQTVGNRNLVMVQTPSGAMTTMIQLGIQDVDMAEVKSGLKENDRIAATFSASSTSVASSEGPLGAGIGAGMMLELPGVGRDGPPPGQGGRGDD